MKAWWKVSLAAVLVLLLAVAPALALGDSPDEALVKLQTFLDELLAQGTPVDVQTLDDGVHELEVDGIPIKYYELADYLSVSADGDESEFIYELSMLHADRPDEVDADVLYAQFLSICTGSDLDAATDAIARLHESMVRTSYYGIDGAITFGDYSVLFLASMTDSGVTLRVLHFSYE